MQVLAITLSAWTLASQAGVPADLAAAKALYAVADYEEALKALSADDAGSDAGEADKYRALCLLALGRMDEVGRLLESVVVHNPSYRWSDADVTPRLVAQFHQTRKRLLPGIVKDSYAAAQASFDGGRYADASSQLKALMTLLGDEDAASEQHAMVTRDLKQVAQHFLDLVDAAQANASKTDASAAAPAAGPAAAASDPGPSPAAAIQPLSDEDAIVEVVHHYVRAYEALDPEGVVHVFQGENPNPLRAAFDALKSQRVDARNLRIAVDAGGWSATVKLTWAVEAIPKVGSPRKTQMPATLRMLKVATGEWFIVARR